MAAERPTIIVRAGGERDLPGILELHEQAFGEEGREIADLVSGLMDDDTASPILSLLARVRRRLAGHVLFTGARVVEHDVEARILAPLAVLPAFQNVGVGGALVREGLRRLSESGVGLVFVLGYPEYYRRFGFEPAGVHGLRAPYPIPAARQDAWMVLALGSGLLGTVEGTIACAQTLDSPGYW